MDINICHECGTENDEKFLYCQNCGAELSSKEEAEPLKATPKKDIFTQEGGYAQKPSEPQAQNDFAAQESFENENHYSEPEVKAETEDNSEAAIDGINVEEIGIFIGNLPIKVKSKFEEK